MMVTFSADVHLQLPLARLLLTKVRLQSIMRRLWSRSAYHRCMFAAPIHYPGVEISSYRYWTMMKKRESTKSANSTMEMLDASIAGVEADSTDASTKTLMIYSEKGASHMTK